MRSPTPLSRALALVLALLLSACDSKPPGESVLLVTLDTTRADYLGCYGAPEPTPAIDLLASRGTRFDLAISSASVTPVSHATILTGRSNPAHGLRVFAGEGGFVLPDGVPSLAEILHDQGYRTGAIHSAFPVSSYFHLNRGFELFDDLNAQTVETPNGFQQWDMKRYQRRSDETTERVLGFLRETSRPFFLWIHYWDPHDADLLPPDYELADDGDDPYRTGLYGEEVRYVDQQLGRVTEALEALGLAESTIVAVVADHGQGLGDHGWLGHRILYQEQVRVPLVIVAPGLEQQPVVEELVRSMDIAPTILDLLGLELPGGITGHSLVGLMTGRAEEPRIAFADQINGFDDNASMRDKRPWDTFLYMAMDARWKLTYRPTHVRFNELYDLQSDPKELHNVFAEQPEVALRLMKQLAFEAPWVTEPFERIEVDGRETAHEAMSALGYIEGSDSEDGAPGEDGSAPAVSTWTEWEWLCPDPAHEELNGKAARGDRCEACGTPMIPRVPNQDE